MGGVAEGDAAERDQVGDYVRRLLPHLLKPLFIDWPVEVEWEETRIVAKLVRGELVVTAIHRARGWWKPASKPHARGVADELAHTLHEYRRPFIRADETGRCRAILWKLPKGLSVERVEGAVPVPAILEPGVYLGERSGGGTGLVFRHGDDAGATLSDAIGMGWVRVTENLNGEGA